LELDHVLIAVPELDEAGRGFEASHGLASVEGGRHAGWGTANRIVPLGDAYVELITVVDEQEAAGSAFGRWVAAGIRSRPGRALGWVARTDHLDEVAGRLGLAVSAGSRPGGAGRVLRWRLAGVEQAAAEPSLPFFVEWGEGMALPGQAAVSHPAGEVRLQRLDLTGDEERVTNWLGSEALPIVVTAGPPAVRGVVLAGRGGPWALDRVDRG
jgi:Glyoxalase-like domain